MHRDGHTEAQLTAIYLHHWAAEVDSALGVRHNRTLTRQQVVEYVEGLGLYNVTLHDWAETNSDPLDEAIIQRLEGLIDGLIRRAKGVSNYEALRRQGEELRRRLYAVGSTREPVIVVVGEKEWL
jgi:hypothetical protein